MDIFNICSRSHKHVFMWGWVKRVIILGLVIVGLTISQGFAAKTKRSVDPHRIKVRPGQTFKIDLQSNPTTGYMWQIRNPIDKTRLVIVNKTFAPKSKKLVGSPGHEVWQFKALKKGTIYIEFAYKRSWENEVVKRETYAVVIK